MIGTGFGLTFGAFTALCLAMDRHQRDVFGHRLPPRRARALRWAGWLLLAASLPVCLLAGGGGLGVVRWCGALTLAAALLVVLLAFVPRAVVAAGGTLPVLGAAADLLSR